MAWINAWNCKSEEGKIVHFKRLIIEDLEIIIPSTVLIGSVEWMARRGLGEIRNLDADQLHHD